MECGNLKVDLACSTNKAPGYLGVDISPESDAEIIHDLTKGLPFCNDSCIELRAHNFCEHLTNNQYIDFTWECWRCLKHEGLLDILVPKGNTDTHIKDPTHRHNGFSAKMFIYWEAGCHRQKEYKLPPFKNIRVLVFKEVLRATMQAYKLN